MAKNPLSVEALKHDSATRRNIPTAEYESVMREDEKAPVQLAYERRNRDLDPQLVWRGKDEQDWSDLIVQAPPLYIQEKVHPKAIIDELKRESQARREEAEPSAPDLFADFNGLKDKEAATEFYQHDQHWSNRMISGDSLSVMASLAEREGLRGKVQCIYFDPPYGIKFNSNFQWSTTSRDVKDGAKDQITREPEQVRAFRDTWKDGIHSYLTYLRDRLTVARDLLDERGALFFQIGSENQHIVAALLDEVFGAENFIANIVFRKKTMPLGAKYVETMHDHILFYGRDASKTKFRHLFQYASELTHHWRFVEMPNGNVAGRSKEDIERNDVPAGGKVFRGFSLLAPSFSERDVYSFRHKGRMRPPPNRGSWVVSAEKLARVQKADRLLEETVSLGYKLFHDDYPYRKTTNLWADHSVSYAKSYVVQTAPEIIARCILMTTDPGDLVLDPTCGSGTTAYVAEQWGRRWITIDTSRVAVALARSRLMGARYPFYLLADSPEGQRKEGEITRTAAKSTATLGSIRQGFVYERVPHITLKSIANNAEIDAIWERLHPAVEGAVAALNSAIKGCTTPFVVSSGGRAGKAIDFTAQGNVELPTGELAPANGFMEWEIPREAPLQWPQHAKDALASFWAARGARQGEIDASITAKADAEYLYDKPYTDKAKVRVAGPFTVESLSPHRTLAVDWDDELIDVLKAAEGKRKAAERDESVHDFAHMILENLKAAGVQQARKEDRISFSNLIGWPGEFICAEGTYIEGEKQKRAGIFIGPEFGTVSRPDLVAAAREAGDAGFDVLIACAFNYDAHSAEFDKLGRVPVLKARMNPDLHMGSDLKATGAGNLFVIFGEPDIKILDAADGMKQVKVFGVDVFKPQTGEVISEGTDGIALWMLDTDYNEESFFVRHAYFLGANDPYKALKTTLKAEIDQEAWESLNSDISRPFPKPKNGRIAVKVINHLGDEVMKVFKVE